MKCEKCNRTAVVHLTELMTLPDGSKQAIEVHLCMTHAVEAGALASGEILSNKVAASKPDVSPKTEKEKSPPTAITPVESQQTGMTVSRQDQPQEPVNPDVCPICGMTWAAFKSGGVMGCPHDYEHFEQRIAPLIRRAQENATQHAGKMPTQLRQTSPAKQIDTARLRRELEQAVDAENYELAAKLRDELKGLGE